MSLFFLQFQYLYSITNSELRAASLILLLFQIKNKNKQILNRLPKQKHTFRNLEIVQKRRISA